MDSRRGILMPRTWTVQATIAMPKFIRREAGLPKTIHFLNLFLEQRFLLRGFEILMKCREQITKAHAGEEFTYFALQGVVLDNKNCPYFLESSVSAASGHEAVDQIASYMESITVALTFQLQYPVKIVHLEAHSPKEQGMETVDFSTGPYYRIVKDAVAIFQDSVYTTFDPLLISAKIDDEVDASMRWFAKGMAADAVIDKYAFYWIAFEILASSWAGIDAKTALKCPKCHKPISVCPNCGEDTQTRPLIGERIRRVGVDILKRDEKTIEELYQTRHLVHGTMHLQDTGEMEKLPRLTQQLRALAIDAIKTRLSIPISNPPIGNRNVPIMWSTMSMTLASKE